MLIASLNDRMPGWLTLPNALWCLTVLAMIAAVCIIALYAGRERPTERGFLTLDALDADDVIDYAGDIQPTDWDAPATDADEAGDYAGDIPPVAEDDHGNLVCAAPVDDLPSGICGWPVKHDPCPAHGRLVRGAA